MVKNILIINIGIHLIGAFMNIPFNDFLGLRVVFSDQFAPYQFFTYMWLHSHAGIWHLFGNMLMVFFIGPMLESAWGSKRFLTFYLVCGVGAGVLFAAADFMERLPLKQDAEAYIANPSPDGFYNFIVKHKKSNIDMTPYAELSDLYYENENDPVYRNQTIRVVEQFYDFFVTQGGMVGASGAIFGLLFAFAYLFPNTEFFLLFPPIPVKAKYLAFFLGMYALYSEFNRAEGDNVAHLAHLSGMLIAFILLRFWKKDKRNFY